MITFGEKLGAVDQLVVGVQRSTVNEGGKVLDKDRLDERLVEDDQGRLESSVNSCKKKF